MFLSYPFLGSRGPVIWYWKVLGEPRMHHLPSPERAHSALGPPSQSSQNLVKYELFRIPGSQNIVKHELFCIPGSQNIVKHELFRTPGSQNIVKHELFRILGSQNIVKYELFSIPAHKGSQEQPRVPQ